MNNSLKGKRIVITGASSGIGRALAIESIKRGAKVSIGARNTEALATLAEEINSDNLFYTKLDVTQQKICEDFIHFSAKKLGGIDILINNAGISMRANFSKLEISVIEDVMRVNFFGAVYCTHVAMPIILQTKGSIVGISSVAGFNGLPGRTGYSASKFALQGFLESLKTENLKTGIHVMIVCPGFTESNIRNTALNAQGQAQNNSPREENKMMSSEETAVKILDAIQKRKDKLILTTQGKMSYFLSKFSPKLLRKLTYKVMKSEPDSPF